MNASICEIFFSSVDLASVKTIHIFLPIQKKREPDTWLIIDRLKSDYPHIKISIPKMTGDHQLINYYFENRTQVRENQWHIPEPEFGVLTPTKAIDLVIVPLLVFDKAGHRLGYGKGFYDRFLSMCRTDCKKVGLSFFEPIESIAFEKTDVALTCAITPTRSYAF
jgi:5-formyltetrahydrofolate cyclo-ligase